MNATTHTERDNAMARTTINKINALLPEGIEIVKGVDYFYFATEIGSEVADELDPIGFYKGSSVLVYHLSTYTNEEWVQQYHALRDNN